MPDTVILAIVGMGSTLLIAIAALVANYRGFVSLDGRLTSLENRMTALADRIDSRITDLETQLGKTKPLN